MDSTNQFSSAANPSASLSMFPGHEDVQNPTTQTVVFVDAAVQNIDGLIQGIEDSAIVILDGDRDGIEQVSEDLAQRQNIESVHFLSHGQEGTLRLGNTYLTTDTLTQYQASIQGWGSALAAGADVLFYGCNVAEGETGLQFVHQLDELTGADIAASVDKTGSSELGGNWTFEVQTGSIETEVILSDAAIDEYDSVFNMDGMSGMNISGMNMAGMQMMPGMEPLMDLIHVNHATHQAVQNGDWFDPNTWGGNVPGNGAKVVIPTGKMVSYGGVSDARLSTIRVDGDLTFKGDRDTRMVVDLIVVGMGGDFAIGSKANPVQANKNTEIIFAPVNPNQRTIDLNWDPMQFSRGLVSMRNASVDVWGTEKTPYLSLEKNAYAGDTSLTFDQAVPSDWQVGDHIVLTGTAGRINWGDQSKSHDDNSFFEDEELIITSINGKKVTFRHNDVNGNKLRFNHTIPDGHDLEIYVANLTRNVQFKTEAGENSALMERGHMMFMDQDVEFHNAGLYDMGRSNKDRIVNDPVLNANGSLKAGTGTNRRGRYPIHFHKTLTKPGAYGEAAAQVTGSAIVGSPGWGYTVHTSHAVIEDNVSFDVVGSHYVTEDGDEIGIFRRNIAIKATGAVTDKSTNLQVLDSFRGAKRDVAVRGFGFWFDSSYSSHTVEDNIVASTKDTGFLWYGHNDKEWTEANKGLQLTTPTGGLVEVPVSSLPAHLRHIGQGKDTIAAWRVPNQGVWANNTAYNGESGFEIRGVMRDDYGNGRFFKMKHNERAVVENFQVWGVRHFGMQVGYASRVHLKDSLILGDTDNPLPRGKYFVGATQQGMYGHGALISKNARYTILEDNRIEGFDVGITAQQTEGQSLQIRDEDRYDETPFGPGVLIGGYFANNTYNIAASPGRVDNPAPSTPLYFNAPFNPYFQLKGEVTFDGKGGNRAPVAKFKTQSKGSSTFTFDGHDSIDLDYAVNPKGIDNRNSIVSYLWDFNGDGVTDDWGWLVDRTFSPGTHNVSLTVYDEHGASTIQRAKFTVNGNSGNLQFTGVAESSNGGTQDHGIQGGAGYPRYTPPTGANDYGNPGTDTGDHTTGDSSPVDPNPGGDTGSDTPDNTDTPSTDVGNDSAGDGTNTNTGSESTPESNDDSPSTPVNPGEANILFVAGSTTLNVGDRILYDRLIQQGYQVTVQDDGQTTGDVTGFNLVFLSESINPDQVGAKFRDADVPVIASDSYVYNDLGLTQTTRGTHYGVWGEQKVYLEEANHPLAQGLSSSNPNVYGASSSMHWGVPGNEANVIARFSGKTNEAKATVFAYDTGAKLANGTVTDQKRVALFGNSTLALTDEGLTLFDNAIAWSLAGVIAEPQDDSDDDMPDTDGASDDTPDNVNAGADAGDDSSNPDGPDTDAGDDNGDAGSDADGDTANDADTDVETDDGTDMENSDSSSEPEDDGSESDADTGADVAPQPEEETNSNPAPATPKNILFVAGSTNLNVGDRILYDRLIQQGYQVTVQDDGQTTGDVTGFNLVFLSESINPDQVGAKFRDADVPVIASDSYVYDDLGLTQTTRGTHYGVWGEQKVYLEEANHPLAQGLSSSNPNVYDASSSMHWGVPGNEANVIARFSGKTNESKATVFAYDTGAKLANGTVTDQKRVALFGNSKLALTDEGLTLFDNAISWTLEGAGVRSEVEGDNQAADDETDPTNNPDPDTTTDSDAESSTGDDKETPADTSTDTPAGSESDPPTDTPAEADAENENEPTDESQPETNPEDETEVTTDVGTPPEPVESDDDSESSNEPKAILFIAGSTTLKVGDQRLRDRLIADGYQVTIQDDDQATGDVSEFDLVYISESVNPGRLGDKFLNVPVPLISSDSYSYDDLGLTQTTRGTDYGVWGEEKVYVVNSGHPLTQGLSSQTPAVYNGSQAMHWGRPGADADIIAKYSSKGSETKATVFTYDQGSQLANGNVTDQKRAALFGNSGHELTDDGLILFANAIKWALS